MAFSKLQPYFNVSTLILKDIAVLPDQTTPIYGRSTQNPKEPLFITNSFRDPVTIILFALVLTLVGFAAISSWALGGNIFRKALRDHFRLFNFAMAGLLVYTAISSLL
jgi:hypothetical protein